MPDKILDKVVNIIVDILQGVASLLISGVIIYFIDMFVIEISTLWKVVGIVSLGCILYLTSLPLLVLHGLTRWIIPKDLRK